MRTDGVYCEVGGCNNSRQSPEGVSGGVMKTYMSMRCDLRAVGLGEHLPEQLILSRCRCNFHTTVSDGMPMVMML